MKKNIWILNHYATNTFFEKGGRHYWIGENLLKEGYNPIIFCASTLHGKGEGVEVEGEYCSKKVETQYGPLTYVFIKVPPYTGNGKSRIKNMTSFALRLKRKYKILAREFGYPDIIYASSVHPLTLVAGIKISKQFNIKCISEVRDLWPESIVAYSSFTKSNPIIKLLYLGEKWIYKHSDALVFSMSGGKKYIVEKGWDKQNGGPINLNKVYYVNNGIDIEEFNKNKSKYIYKDEDLLDPNFFKVVYTGSIRKVNNIQVIVDTAEYLERNNYKEIKLIIFGEGDEREYLNSIVRERNLKNILFKGPVEKKYIPSILSQSDLNLLHQSESGLLKYGGSQNKKFEYLASGKPILSTVYMDNDVIENFDTGYSIRNQDPKIIAEAIVNFSKMSTHKYNEVCKNALKASREFDFPCLTDKMIQIIESL